MRSSRRSLGLALLLSAAALPAAASAQTTILWSGAVTAGPHAWNTTTNWTGGNVANSNTEIADLRRDWTGLPTFNLGSATTINGIYFDDTGANPDINGVGTIANGGTAANSLTLSGTNAFVDVNTGLNSTNGTVGHLVVTAQFNTTGFTKTGPGIFSIANVGTISGPITLAGGQLRFLTNAPTLTNAFNVTASSTLYSAGIRVTMGTGAVTLSNGVTLTFNSGGGGSTAFTVTNGIGLASGAASANVTFNHDSTNTSTYNGTLNIGSGNLTKSSTAILNVSGTVRLGTITASGGTFGIAAAVIGQGGDDGQSLALAGANDATVSGAITASTLTKSGNGMFILQNAANSIGSLTVNAGSIGLGNATAVASAVPITLAGGSLVARGGLRVVANTLTAAAGTTSGLGTNSSTGALAFTGTLLGSGNLSYNTTAAQTLWLSGDFSAYTGTLTYNAGADQAVSGSLAFGGVDGASADGTGGSDFAAAKLVLQGANSLRTVTWEGTAGTTVKIGELSSAVGEGRIGIGASERHANWEIGGLNTDATYGGAFLGAATSLTKVGNGVLTLSGESTHGGGTVINAGTLALGASQRLSDTGAVTVNAGTFALGAFNETVGAFTLASGAVTGTGILNVASLDVRSGSISAALSGSTGLTKTTAATVVLSGANSFSGASDVQEGHLSLAGGSLTSDVNVAAGAAFGGRGAAAVVNLAAGSVLEGGHLGLGALAAQTVNVAGPAFFRLRSAGVAGGLSAYAADSGVAAIGIGDLALAEGASVKLQVVGAIGTVADGTYAFLNYGNLTQFDLSSFIKPESSDAGSALGPRQNTSLAYSEIDNTVLLTIAGVNPTWVGDQVAGVWSGADNWRLGPDSEDPRTSFLARDTVRFDDTGAGGVISLTEDAQAGVVNVVSDTVAYTFANAGGGFTSGLLNKSGASALTLVGAHNLTTVNLVAGSLRVGSASSLGSAALELNGGRLQAAGTDPLTLANSVRLVSASTLGDATDSGALTFASRLDLDAKASDLTVVSDVTLAGGVGNGTLRKLGAGTLTLGDDALGLVGVNLVAGRVRAGSTLALGSAPLTLAGGALSSDSATARSFAGAVTLAADSTLGDATDSGALTFTGGLVVGDTDARTLTIASEVTFATGVVSGAANWTKSGAGQLNLTAANTFSGTFTVAGGLVKLGNASALGANTAGTTVLAGGTIDLNGIRAVNEVYTIAGDGIDGQGAIINTGADLFNGGVDHLVLAADATVGGAKRFDIRNGVKTLDLAGFQLTKKGAMYMSLAGATVTDGDIRIEEGNLGFESGTLVQGTGTVNVVTGGTLSIAWGAQAANITRDIVLDGGTIYTGGANSAANSAITLRKDSSISVASGFTLTLNGVLSGDFGLTKSGAGAVLLAGANTFSGPIQVTGGALRAGSDGALGTAPSVSLAADSTAQLILADGLSFERTLTIGGGTGGVAGQGALHLSGAAGTSATWSGPITVLADIATGGHFGTGGGTLNLTGAISAAAGVPVEFRSGTSVLSGEGSAYSILFLHSDATVRLGAENILPAGVAIQMGTSGNAAILDLAGFSQSAGSLSNGTSAFTNTGTGIRNNNTSTAATLTLTGSTIGEVANTVISNTAAATGVLSLSPGTGASLGVVLDTGASVPVIHGTLGITIGASLSSANGFTKTGAGNLTLSGDNTAGLFGTSDIQGGTLVSSATGALGSGVIRLSNPAAASSVLLNFSAAQTQVADFEFAASGDVRATNVAVTLNGDAVLSEGVTINYRGLGGGNNRFAITGNTSLAEGATTANVTFQTDSAQTHTYTGSMNLGAGTLTKSSTARLDMAGSLVAGTIVASGGTFNIASAVTAGGADGSLVLAGNAGSSFSGGITAASVAKTGTGQVAVSGASDIDAFSLAAGTLVVASGSDLLGASVALSLGGETTTGKLVLGSAAAAANQTLSSLVFNGLGGTIVGGNASATSILTLDLSSDLSLGAFLGGTGTNENRIGLAKAGSGTLTLTTAGTFTGGVSVSGGTLAFIDPAALGSGTVTVSTGGTFDFGGFNLANTVVLAGGLLANDANWTGDININGDVTAASINSISRSTVTIIGGNIDISGVTKNLVVQGGNLTGFSNYSGNLTVSGPLTLGSDPLGTVTVVAGGILDLDGRSTSKGITYSGGTFTNAASYTGDVTLALAAPATLATGTFGGGRVVVGTGQSVTLGANYVGDILLTGTGSLLGGSLIGYTGEVTLGTGASLSLTTAGQGGSFNNRAASFVLQAGSFLRGQGKVGDVVVLAGGTLAPGNSPGILELGNTVLNGGGRIEMEIWRSSDPILSESPGTPGVDYDSVDVEGELDLSALSASARFLVDLISLTGDGTMTGPATIFSPDAEYSFTLLTYDTIDLGANAVLGTDLSSLFAIDTTDMFDDQGNALAADRFRVMLDSGSNSLVLTYSVAIPEPSTYGLMIGGLALAAAAIRRRRKIKEIKG